MQPLIWFLKVVLAILCAVCLLKMPYQYYVFFRYIAFTLFLLFCLDASKKKHINLCIVWAVSALMSSPFIKPVLGRTLWNVVDVIWIIVLLGSLVSDFRNIHRGKRE
ncbi:DUF6804 family protein [Chitinophaga nivalis]|uniref:DUF6804 family protein n=1 Tax=Chitinophaga nivalis TaxID=2991709 RepID=UPI003530A320